MEKIISPFRYLGKFSLALTLLTLFSWGCSRENLPEIDPSLLSTQKIRVEAKQYSWEVTHAGPDDTLDTADDIHTQNLIIVPRESRLELQLSSMDVVHGFWVPRLGIRQTMVPGTMIQREVVLLEPGNFKLACSELCGIDHAKMVGWLRVLPDEDFQRWLSHGAGVKNAGLD